MRKSLIMMALYGGLAAAAYFGFINLLTGFVPIEDQGYLMISAQLPDASSLQRTGKLVNKVTKQLEKTAGVASWISVIGYSILDGSAAPNGAAVGVISDARFQPDPRCITDGFSAAKQRFRPILMTAISSILGVLPLVVASGAGAASRQAVGTAVFGGMVAATCLSVLFVPVFYVVIQRISEGRRKKRPGRG